MDLKSIATTELLEMVVGNILIVAKAVVVAHNKGVHSEPIYKVATYKFLRSERRKLHIELHNNQLIHSTLLKQLGPALGCCQQLKVATARQHLTGMGSECDNNTTASHPRCNISHLTQQSCVSQMDTIKRADGDNGGNNRRDGIKTVVDIHCVRLLCKWLAVC